jgi:hypothetical protein
MRITDRDAAIKLMAQEGKTLQEIGAHFGFTRERARQICDAIGIKTCGHKKKPINFDRVKIRSEPSDKTQCRTDVTIDRVRQLLIYDSDTGIWKWQISHGDVSAGEVATKMDGYGYLYIKIDGKIHKAHTLAWLYVFGYWPKNMIDHKNRIKHDNRLSNLREANYFQNLGNSTMRASNTSGFKGVRWHKRSGKWRATIAHITIGHFDSAEEAAEAYETAARIRYGEFAFTGS